MSEATVGFALSVGHLPPTFIPVQSFEGTEGISRLHRFKIQIETPIPALALEAAALGSTSTLSIRSAGHDRHVHGIISSVRREDTKLPAAPSHHVFTLTLVPHAWLLTRRHGSRIFQDVSIVDVINTVLDEYQLPRVWELAHPRPKRVYITQYEESDWDFVRRLAAENGLLFHFRHPEVGLDAVVETLLAATPTGGSADVLAAVAGFAFEGLARLSGPREVITFTDQALYLPISALALPFLDSGAGAPGHDYVSRFTSRRAIRSTAATFTEYDWRRPLSKIESASRDKPGSPFHVALPGEPSDLEVYEHRARDHEPDWADAAHEASRMLQIARRDAVRYRGESSSARLVPGRQFALEGHSIEEGTFAVVKVRHRGSRRPDAGIALAYGNHFEAVPSTVPYLVPPPPKRNIQAHLTAIVAGPPGHELHVNESGQIKVKFHWDRRDDRSNPTCWLRCMHPWAGKGWGFQFIPRVGMEVVIGFEGGDPDRPLVLGTVYNAVQPEPFTLPVQATRSGIRTQSTPRSSGFNELSFEDKADEEQIFVHAQRDLDAVVLRDRTGRIGRDDHENVDGSQLIEVGGSRRLEVKRDQDVVVRGAMTEETVGPHAVTRSSLRSHIIEDRIDHIDGMLETHVRECSAHHTHKWKVDRIDGNSTQLVGHGTTPGDWAVDVKGNGEIRSGKRIHISAEEEITLRCGNSHIRIGGDCIEIVSGKVVLRGEDAQVVLADQDVRLLAQNLVRLRGECGVVAVSGTGASMKLGAQASLAGSQVLLNSPAQNTDSFEESSVTTTAVTLRDSEGNPLPFQRYRVVFDDGHVQTGVTDADGNAVIEGAGAGEIEFPDHTDPEEGEGGEEDEGSHGQEDDTESGPEDAPTFPPEPAETAPRHDLVFPPDPSVPGNEPRHDLVFPPDPSVPGSEPFEPEQDDDDEPTGGNR